jgi:hypothetical protein
MDEDGERTRTPEPVFSIVPSPVMLLAKNSLDVFDNTIVLPSSTDRLAEGTEESSVRVIVALLVAPRVVPDAQVVREAMSL